MHIGLYHVRLRNRNKIIVETLHVTSLDYGQSTGHDIKGKIVDNVRRIAYQRYAILTARVNPKDTS